MKKTNNFGTQEWAVKTVNCCTGCSHDCLYCYAKAMSVRHKKIDISRWNEPIIRQKMIDKNIGTRKGTTMFPSTHDLHPENLDVIIPFLRKLLSTDNNVLIVSKPHLEVIKEICKSFSHNSYKNRILFRFTIGSWDDDILKAWEPGAPNFYERISSLHHAFNLGYKTSVSMEPMLDRQPWKTISQAKPYVTDSIWLGKMNDWKKRLKVNAHSISKIHPDLIGHIESCENDDKIWNLYYRFKEDPIIKWKESIKKVVGIKLPTEKGLDI